MKNLSRTKRISVLSAAGVLVLSGAAFGSAAFAADTTTPSPTPVVSPAPSIGQPTIAPMPGSGSGDSELSDDSEAQAVVGDSEALSALDAQASPDQGSAEPQESDNEVDAINTENSDEQASFSDDISAAVQAGDTEDVAQLTTAATIVTSVTAPEAAAMAADDTAAHALIAGVATK